MPDHAALNDGIFDLEELSDGIGHRVKIRRNEERAKRKEARVESQEPRVKSQESRGKWKVRALITRGCFSAAADRKDAC